MQSMTGFGRGEFAGEDLIVRVEITTVNRKQADIHFSLPRDLSALEADLRKQILQYVSRGRVNVSIHLERAASQNDTIALDPGRAQALEGAFQKLSTLLERPILPTASDFIKSPGIITFEESGWDPEAASSAIIPALNAALKNLVEMRTAEGQDLAADLTERLQVLADHAKAIAAATPAVVERQRELLHSRLREAGLDIDLNDERVLKEIAIFAERADISEETTRLSAHFKRFRDFLGADEPAGRSLDFLCQEINREFNTIGSKGNDAGIAQHVVAAKTELEKVREQVQNIE